MADPAPAAVARSHFLSAVAEYCEMLKASKSGAMERTTGLDDRAYLAEFAKQAETLAQRMRDAPGYKIKESA